MIKKLGLFFLAVCILMTPLSVYADEPYTYDENKQPINSVAGYEPSQILFGADLGIGYLSEPSDLYVDQDQNLYILDTGNNRVVICDRNYQLVQVIEEFTLNGEASPLWEPKGIYVSENGELYIADTGNARVIRTDRNGVIQQEYLKPTSELFPQDNDFIPNKVLCYEDSVFVICENIHRGAVTYSTAGNFLGYYGSNQVEVTFSMLVDRLWRSLFSRSNSDKFVQNVAVEFTSFDKDAEGFIYTCTANSTASENMVRKLNPIGDNVFEKAVQNSFQGGFGDLNPTVSGDQLNMTQFVDIEVTDGGMLLCLDQSKNRVFQYDKDANLVFIFGGSGNQIGNFLSPVAIESISDKVLVLDELTGSVTEFKLSEFGSYVNTAVNLYNEGKYIESVEPWNQVLKMDSNYSLAYVGIGKANLELKQYDLAKENFKQAGYISGYDSAFGSARTQEVRDHFYIVFILIIVLLLAIYLPKIKPVRACCAKAAAAVRKTGFARFMIQKKQGVSDAVSIMAHPIEGYNDLFYRKNQRYYMTFILAGLYFFSALLRDRLYGFVFAGNRQPQSTWFVLLTSIGLLVLFSVINWSICTLFTGNGKVKDIWVVVTYSLQPTIIANFVSIILSNVLKSDEGVFITYFMLIAEIYSVFLLIKGMETIHEYSFKKSIVTIAATVLGMILIAILFVLLLSLVQQIFTFLITVYREASLRFR